MRVPTGSDTGTWTTVLPDCTSAVTRRVRGGSATSSPFSSLTCSSASSESSGISESIFFSCVVFGNATTTKLVADRTAYCSESEPFPDRADTNFSLRCERHLKIFIHHLPIGDDGHDRMTRRRRLLLRWLAERKPHVHTHSSFPFFTRAHTAKESRVRRREKEKNAIAQRDDFRGRDFTTAPN